MPPGLMVQTWPGSQGIGADAVLALQLGRDDELLDAVRAHHVAEMGVAEFGGADALLLLLDAAAAFHGHAHGPFQVFVRHVGFGDPGRAA